MSVTKSRGALFAMLVATCLCTVAFYNIPFSPRGVGQIKHLMLSVRGETFGPDNSGCTGSGTPYNCCTGSGTGNCSGWTDEIGYYSPFTDGNTGASSSIDIDPVFQIIPLDGDLNLLRAYNDGGGLDASESATITLMECADGDLPTCAGTWTATAKAVTATGDGTATDRVFDDTDDVAVTAGDVFAMRFQNDSTDWPDSGPEESLNILMTFTPTDPGKTFVTSTVERAGGGSANRFFPLVGTSPALQAIGGNAFTVIPGGNFTLDGFMCAQDADAGNASAGLIEICRYDGGVTTTGCDNGSGNTGELLASCSMTTTTSTCEDFTPNVALSEDDLLYYSYEHAFDTFIVTCGAVFDTTVNEFMISTTGEPFGLSNYEAEHSGSGSINPGIATAFCGGSGSTSEQWCAVGAPQNITIKNMVGHFETTAVGASESWTVEWMDASAGSGGTMTSTSSTCTFNTSDTDCTIGTDATITSGDVFLMQHRASGTMDLEPFTVSTLIEGL